MFRSSIKTVVSLPKYSLTSSTVFYISRSLSLVSFFFFLALGLQFTISNTNCDETRKATIVLLL